MEKETKRKQVTVSRVVVDAKPVKQINKFSCLDCSSDEDEEEKAQVKSQVKASVKAQVKAQVKEKEDFPELSAPSKRISLPVVNNYAAALASAPKVVPVQEAQDLKVGKTSLTPVPWGNTKKASEMDWAAMDTYSDDDESEVEKVKNFVVEYDSDW
jgi:subtilisin family serine protease